MAPQLKQITRHQTAGIAAVIVVLVVIGAMIMTPGRHVNETPAAGMSDKQQPHEAERAKQAPPEVARRTITPGDGAVAETGDTVTVHYVGTLEDGTVFDTSRTRGTPFTFTLGAGSVIPGWEVGVPGMAVGEVRELIIPPSYAYGEQGVPNAIPPNATLHFEVELVEIVE